MRALGEWRAFFCLTYGVVHFIDAVGWRAEIIVFPLLVEEWKLIELSLGASENCEREISFTVSVLRLRFTTCFLIGRGICYLDKGH